ncbi:hypothetical protein TRFO_22486 [Tritrichomonas foetus]|uniref:DUF3447 domain-containing protein n=1 Tax=Tritrichomonas foetus TaxID=1144522 RepID=A0A1J4KGG6_9EUKA|nr:hypothetical protein TRFO_22486 [Tritrichomonas foetus]|eukprot:OHT08892.1 hypothetical protein TRFO_22486 [Tritrichomonas foetus]
MELKGISEFRKDLEIIQNFQRKMISIISCVKSQISSTNQINELFDFFEEISISKHFSLYEAFLRIFVHLSIYFNFPETKEEEIITKRQEIFFLVLKELILKHSLKTSISQLTLFLIFQSNPHFLLFLFEEGIFDVSFLSRKIFIISRKKFSSFQEKNLLLFLIPEIKKLNLKFYGKSTNQLSSIEEYIDTFYEESKGISTTEEDSKNEQEFENHSGNRSKIHSEEEIAKIIRTDDVDYFMEFISRIDNFDLDSKIQPSFLENNPDINNSYNYDNQGINILEYSMAFGSINIYRYLLLNKVKYSKESLKYCLIGNNYEILHHLEEETKIEFDKNCYLQCIEYYHPEIIEYFLNYSNDQSKDISKEMNSLSISSIINIFHETTNIEILFEFFSNKSIFPHSKIDEFHYFSSLNNFSSAFDINKILLNLWKSSKSPFYFIYFFLLQQSNIDINSKDNIFCF